MIAQESSPGVMTAEGQAIIESVRGVSPPPSASCLDTPYADDPDLADAATLWEELAKLKALRRTS